jgi:hypothetical protein
VNLEEIFLDVVYICRIGRNPELMYSIRSVVENLPHDKIWVAGGKPNWYKGKFMGVKQGGTKYQNAREILEAICENPEISDEFILMNDDFFITDKLDDLKTYHGGLLEKKVAKYTRMHPNSIYTGLLQHTFVNLRDRYGIEHPLDYELHVPMKMDKYGLYKAVTSGLLWRSVYGNLNNVGGEKINDVKVYLGGREEHQSYDFRKGSLPFVSTEDRSFSVVYRELLKDKFPNRSKYEIPGYGGY